MLKRFGAIKNPIFDMPHYMSVRSGWRGCLLEEEEEPGEEEEAISSVKPRRKSSDLSFPTNLVALRPSEKISDL